MIASLSCLPIHGIAQRIFEHVLPCRKTSRQFLREVFPTMVTCQLLRQKYVIRTSLYIPQKWFHPVCINVEYIPKKTWSRNEVGSSRSTFFNNFYHVGAIFWFIPTIFMSSTYTDKNNPCFLWTFSLPSFNRTSSDCRSHNNPADGCSCKFCSRGTTGSSMFAQDFGHLCRGRRIHTSGHSDLKKFWAIWERPPILLECRQILHQLLVRHNLVILQ